MALGVCGELRSGYLLLVAEVGGPVFRAARGMALTRLEWLGARVWLFLLTVVSVGLFAALVVLGVGGLLMWMDRR